MKAEAVNQLVAGYADGDAISREARVLRDIFRKNGYCSHIYASPGNIADGVKNDCRELSDYKDSPSDILINHYSIASESTLLFLNSKGRRIVRYHNITPPEFFDGFDDDLASQLRRARAELPDVLAGAHSIWPVSQFNAVEIGQSGAGNIKILPLVCARPGESPSPNQAMSRLLGNQVKNILFVGRIVPNKRIEELIEMFAWIYKEIDSNTRLLIVGSERSCPRYCAMLRLYASRLNMVNACFAGFVKEEELSACYQKADVFVSASRHEGFCLPLLEAMSQGTPVVARKTGGMPEAVGSGGVLFDGASSRELAVLVHRVMTDPVMRELICEAQSKRLEEHYRLIDESRVISLLESVT